MMILTDQEKIDIRTAIRDAEMKTSGEIVTVIARSADDYLFIPTLWAGLLALLTPSILLFMPWSMDYLVIYTVQVVVFFVSALLFRLTPLKMALVPKAVKYRRASRLAHQQFVQQGVHRTEKRNGLLLFVAIDECYVEIMADQGINDCVASDTWKDIVDTFVSNVKQQQVAEGFISAIKSCGQLLQQHFPEQVDDANELPDHLIEI